jgi:hypothetical protein
MGFQKASLYIEPNRSYEVFFPPLDSSQVINPSLGYNASLTISPNDSNDINLLIIDFNERFHKFWEENYQYFVLKQGISRMDSFQQVMRKRYSSSTNKYFRSHLAYFFASNEVSLLKDKRKIASRYLYKRSVLYHNQQYMEFFNAYFENYLYNLALKKEGSDIFTYVNLTPDHKKLMKILSADKLLRDDTLCEFVLLKGLTEAYHNPDFSRPGVMNVITQIASSGISSYHREIAQNLVSIYTRLQPGTKFQDFKKKYSSKVEFVSICTDEDTAAFMKFLKENPKFNWTMLYGGKDPSVKNNYNVKAVPVFYFINQQGMLQQSPAYKPSDGIEAVFYSLIQRGKPKKLPWERKDEE